MRRVSVFRVSYSGSDKASDLVDISWNGTLGLFSQGQCITLLDLCVLIKVHAPVEYFAALRTISPLSGCEGDTDVRRGTKAGTSSCSTTQNFCFGLPSHFDTEQLACLLLMVNTVHRMFNRLWIYRAHIRTTYLSLFLVDTASYSIDYLELSTFTQSPDENLHTHGST